MLQRLKSAFNVLLGASAEVPVWLRAWDADGGGNRLANWSASTSRVNQFWTNPINLQARAEDEERNNPIARRAINSLCAATIGAGGINPQLKDKAVKAAWDKWTDGCDAEGRLDWVQSMDQILRAVAISGEVFVRYVYVAGGLKLLILPPVFLDRSRVDIDTLEGIEYSGLTRAAYWLFERHPSFIMTPLRSVRIPADQVLHIFRPHAPGAQRGVTWLAPVLLDLYELKQYLEAALVKAKVSALFAGFVRTADGSNPLASANTAVPTLEPGSMGRLQPGEEVEFTTPPDAGPTFDPFVRTYLRRIAAGLNIPYEILTGDLSAITFASGRHGLLEWRRHIESIQHNLLVAQFCQPVFERWQLLFGNVDQMIKPRWIGPTIAMLDERADTAATVAKIRAGLTSRSESVSATGWNIEEIDAEIAADNARADGLKLVLDSDPRKTTMQGMEQQSQIGAVQQ